MGIICCNPITRIITGVYPGGGSEPPVLADYCVYWSTFANDIFFPCGTDNEVNGETGALILCGGHFNITDFQEAGNIFLYSVGGSGWYVQMIVPNGNATPVDFGTRSFDIFGTPSGPITIEPIQDSNCFLNCYTATFDVDDVTTQGITQLNYSENIDIDWVPIPFSDPGHDAFVLAQMADYFEPSVTFVSSYVGNTVTITITSILTPNTFAYGAPGGPDFGGNTFSPCT